MRKFLALSYHYIRPAKEIDPFPRILGNKIDDFTDHIKTLGRHYHFVSPKEVEEFYNTGKPFATKGKIGLLLTFDDGLADHYHVAKLLNNFGIKALFFIPSCIIEEKLPANPIIINYCLAKYGIASFINSLACSADKLDIRVALPKYKKGGDVWETIASLKRTMHYGLNASDSRKLLLSVYRNTFYNDHKNALEIMHLTVPRIKEMLYMGHAIGSHSHSHFSAANISGPELKHELEISKLILEKNFGVNINAFSYTFGLPTDCLSARKLISLTSAYNLAFTIDEKINTNKTSPLELGRYMPTSKDTSSSIRQKLISMS